ncbi:MAG: dTDP-4-dehydrorhamnose reductase (EC [uncultured Campylobacterales bacterium]|uniref:dTDP-4-dehydrorhamnose reductase n=1 Tax=uncultured Campylobacterales bacterium TaxID=352960 RepID=A0A6S6TCW0_9BACT|nr:MAG: dTDP-4-dehydrorhamnose reductase (EC [uncultured Campylobacterales bacterium]
MNKILVTGANGQLGSEIKQASNNYSEYKFYFTSRKELDISNPIDIENYIKNNNISIIINCAAYTAVDLAEQEKEQANSINNIAVKNLANISKKYNIKLVHISTDYVFDGTNHKPYIETDDTNPKSIYGQTKLDGEQAILSINPLNSIIIRTSWVYSCFGNNFVKTMLKLGSSRDELGVISDQVGTPTYAKDLATSILDILSKIKNNKVEIYHYSNDGVCSWYDFAKNIMDIADIDCKINSIETKEYPTPASRPHYSILNKSKIKNDFEINIPYWKDSLSECIKKVLNDK